MGAVQCVLCHWKANLTFHSQSHRPLDLTTHRIKEFMTIALLLQVGQRILEKRLGAVAVSSAVCSPPWQRAGRCCRRAGCRHWIIQLRRRNKLRSATLRMPLHCPTTMPSWLTYAPLQLSSGKEGWGGGDGFGWLHHLCVPKLPSNLPSSSIPSL